MTSDKTSRTAITDLVFGIIVALLGACIFLAAPFILLAYLWAGQFSSGEAAQSGLLHFLAGLMQAFANVLLLSSLGAGALIVLVVLLWKALRSDPDQEQA
ncbi:hypothetical protein [Labrys neptuniae]